MQENLLIRLIYLTLKNKKFVLVNVSIVTGLSLILALLLPKWYFSYTTLKLSTDDAFSIGAMLGGMTDLPFLGDLGVGLAQSDLDSYEALLESRTLVDSMVIKFDLQKRYDTEYRFLARDAFLDNSIRDGDALTEMLTVGVYDKDPNTAKEMTEYYVELLIRTLQKLSSESARNNRIFADQRVAQTELELRAAEDSLAVFQRKRGVFEPEEQFVVSYRVAAGLEAELMAEEIKLGVVERMFSRDHEEVRNTLFKIDELKKKISGIRFGGSNSEGSNGALLMNFATAPDLAVEYFRLYRDVHIKAKLLEFLIPIYEKARLDEAKSVPSILVVDEPQIAEYKSKPKRAFIVLGGMVLSLFYSLGYLILRESVRRLRNEASPELAEKLDFISENLTLTRRK
jgi:uncharacterized protein involved in exopolysaccharide biosynthesis